MNGYIPHKKSVTTNRPNVDISQEVLTTIQSIKRDVDALTNKTKDLERKYSNSLNDSNRFRINFKNVSNELILFMIVWPIVANFLISKFVRSK